ncbi:MAG: NAD-glutamate dehydrogenase, partial [Actinomycetales bacterium]|nr:NAD-glutamate dehydrogenase [Actinomycetales bacterium]
MAAGSSVINVAILGDAKKFKRAVGEAGDKLGRFGARVGSISTSVAKGFGVMSAAAGGLAIVGGKHFFNLGEELVSLDQKINTVFSGQSLDQVTGWADEVAARMGLTSTQAQGLAANAGDLLKPMGFTADQAASMSTEIIGLSGALSEWSGGQRSVEETAEILSKALLGERDSLKSLGISINQAEVDQRAMTIAVEAGRDAINEQDKALATQQLILEKSTDAQEAYAAGGNKLTAAQNRLKAAFGEIQERIARKLLPVFARLADIAVELIDVFDKDGLGGVISDVQLRIQRAWPAIRTQLGVWARGFVAWLEDVGPPLFAALGDFLLDFGKWFKDDALPVIVEKLGEWGSAFVGWVAAVTPPLLAKLVDLLVDVGRWMINTGLPTLGALAARWGSALIDWVIDVTPGLLRKLVDMIVDVGRWMINSGLPLLVQT